MALLPLGRRRRLLMVGATALDLHRYGRLTAGESRFRQLRESGAVYVDKTGLVDDLIASDHRFVLCRPPLFGKTTTVTMLKELFAGRKYLFDGSVGGSRLSICDTPWDWARDVHQVLHLDTKAICASKAPFRSALLDWMAEKTASLGGRLSNRASLKTTVRDLIRTAAAASPSGRCVVLVDNYDAPIRQGDPLRVMKHGDVVENALALSDWIAGMRAEAVLIRFQFFTGVYKVRLDVFDPAVDVSVLSRFSPICGFTPRELDADFGADLDRFAERAGLGGGRSEALDSLQVWYGGYRWGDVPDAAQVHNPYGVVRALIGARLRPYWSENIILPDWVRQQLQDGADERVRDALAHDRMLLPEAFDAPVRATESGAAARARDRIRLQLLQLGLLTVAHVDYDPDTLLRIARLDVPNRDARSVVDRLLYGPSRKAASVLLHRNP